MKNLSNYSIYVCLGVLSIVSLTLTGCNRSGCTYPQASNYNPQATSDDGSCYFYGTTAMYLDQGTADSLTADGAQYLYMYDDAGFTYGIYQNQYTNTPPECYDYSWPIIYGNEIYSIRQITINDQTGHHYGTFNIPVIGGECTSFRLTGLNWK